MPKHIDLTGNKYNRLEVIEKVGKHASGNYIYLCECDCGNTVEVRGGSLTSGNTQSCGCYSADNARDRWLIHGESSKDNYIYHREKHLQRKYGLSYDEYLAMIDAQDGKCAICSYEFGQKQGDAHVDHDHKTGEVRGILCNICNRGLGYFKDNEQSLINAANYIKYANAR
jgi:hypothetical protein